MRIVSLLPSATEIVCALGLESELVGRSHACDWPPGIGELPALTYSTIAAPDEPLTPREIDRRVSDALREGRSLYGLDLERLLALRPDVIITQALCDVCAVSRETLEHALGHLARKGGVRLLSLEPVDLQGIWRSIERVADLLGVADRARMLLQGIFGRLERLRCALQGIAHRPRVAALEWLDPPFAPGHWVPEQILLAGGECLLGRAGEPSYRTDWETIQEACPEVLLLMPCGYSLQEVLAEARSLLPRLCDLGRVSIWALEANAYFSRPGPRVVEGIELLAQVLHPERFGEPDPSRARLLNPIAIGTPP